MIVLFAVLAHLFFMFMSIGRVKLRQGFFVFVFVFVCLFLTVLFFVVLLVVQFSLFDFGFPRGFKLLVVFLFFLVFVELGAANLRNGFDAVLCLLVLGF